MIYGIFLCILHREHGFLLLKLVHLSGFCLSEGLHNLCVGCLYLSGKSILECTVGYEYIFTHSEFQINFRLLLIWFQLYIWKMELDDIDIFSNQVNVNHFSLFFKCLAVNFTGYYWNLRFTLEKSRKMLWKMNVQGFLLKIISPQTKKLRHGLENFGNIYYNKRYSESFRKYHGQSKLFLVISTITWMIKLLQLYLE